VDPACPPFNADTPGARILGGRNLGNAKDATSQGEQAAVIMPKLRAIYATLGRGKTVAKAVEKIGVTEQTCYRWKKKYGDRRMDQATRLKNREKENSLLNRRRADAGLDKARIPAGRPVWLTHWLDQRWGHAQHQRFSL